MNNSKIPVTILTGFLGSGKTSLLNLLIQSANEKRFAVIENEVGAVNIDSELIVGAGEDIFQITDGCLCCTLNVELAKLLNELVRRRDEFDHLIIETTGIADPAAVAAVFVSDLNVQEQFQLNGIICVVDSLHIDELLRSNETEAARQISFSDALIFNKIDLVNAVQLQQTKQNLKAIHPFAITLDSNLSSNNPQIDVDKILHLNAFNAKKIEVKTQSTKFALEHRHGNITAQTYQYQQPFDFLKFRQFIQVLMHFQSMRIYRMKGILYIADQPNKIIFQSVQQQIVYTKGSKWQENEKPKTTLVVIGNGLNQMAFDKKLKQCF